MELAGWETGNGGHWSWASILKWHKSIRIVCHTIFILATVHFRACISLLFNFCRRKFLETHILYLKKKLIEQHNIILRAISPNSVWLNVNLNLIKMMCVIVLAEKLGLKWRKFMREMSMHWEHLKRLIYFEIMNFFEKCRMNQQTVIASSYQSSRLLLLHMHIVIYRYLPWSTENICAKCHFARFQILHFAANEFYNKRDKM